MVAMGTVASATAIWSSLKPRPFRYGGSTGCHAPKTAPERNIWTASRVRR